MVVLQQQQQLGEPEQQQQQQSERIPRIMIGNMVYTNYPIRNGSREDAESFLASHPQSILIRTSQNALLANPDMYYVASYYSNERNPRPIHTIVSRRNHEECNGEVVGLLPFLSPYARLVMLLHSPDFRDTRISALDPNGRIALPQRD